MTSANSCPFMGLLSAGSVATDPLEGPTDAGFETGAVKKLRLASMVFPSSV